MTTFTDKEMIKEIKERIGSLDVRDNIERRAYEIALTALTTEPFATIDTVGIGSLNMVVTRLFVPTIRWSREMYHYISACHELIQQARLPSCHSRNGCQNKKKK